MSKQRYAIIKVECPPKNEIDAQFVCYPNDNNCGGCRYGDTKEQLVRKVAQVRFRQETQYGSKDMLKAIYNMCYRQAKEIVEFLGVK